VFRPVTSTYKNRKLSDNQIYARIMNYGIVLLDDERQKLIISLVQFDWTDSTMQFGYFKIIHQNMLQKIVKLKHSSAVAARRPQRIKEAHLT
jgi:hypothetical protein